MLKVFLYHVAFHINIECLCYHLAFNYAGPSQFEFLVFCDIGQVISQMMKEFEGFLLNLETESTG